MSDGKRPSDHEIEAISRMARESSRFFSDLARTLGVHENRVPRTSYGLRCLMRADGPSRDRRPAEMPAACARLASDSWFKTHRADRLSRFTQ